MIRRAKALLAPVVLLAGLPLVFFAMTLPANEYGATLGIDALDCDGPFKVYLVALPALLLYGIGFAIAALRWRRSRNAVVALACLAVCALVVPNLLHAVAVDRDQRAACRAR